MPSRILLWFSSLMIMQAILGVIHHVSEIPIVHQQLLTTSYLILSLQLNIILRFFLSFADEKLQKYYFLHLAETALIVGMCVSLYADQDVLHQNLMQMVFVIHAIFSVFMCILLVFRMYTHFPEQFKSHRLKLLLFLLGLISFLAVCILTINFHVRYLIYFLTGASIIFGIAYVIDPFKFFLSSAVIDAIFLYDATTGLSLIHIGGTADYSQLIHGSFLIQREVAGVTETNVFPVELNLGAKKMFVERIEIENHHILGVLVTNQSISAFRTTLKHALKELKLQYRESFKGEMIDLEEIHPFQEKLYAYFAYALVSAEILAPKKE